ncbi:MAG TPA: hypothetical protein VJ697_12795 [Nitrososphaeraceae archaeon]|nr:hypothetical protein [Nitrososphaeraceae archaeon]
MPSEYKDFNKYYIYYTTTEGHVTPSIPVYNDSQSIGYIFFSEKLPPSRNSINEGKITLHYHIDRFNDIINILRYEKPLKIYIDSESLIGGISTGDSEPVGKQELQEI